MHPAPENVPLSFREACYISDALRSSRTQSSDLAKQISEVITPRKESREGELAR
eukprot:CAMPEP_0182862132 /NCGR_PEP_ID=MMETSP0034_2-20130328/5889_1 /TAXON_ID=156128 /ORGANISM="Nephroselmis pyriformis, Strain CCMP717" /LENGTH=53 /DNA_ID=CAMNT_0024994151 /DNA_START=245 /DNA_END=406 /DNA_ORIENTATION=+